MKTDLCERELNVCLLISISVTVLVHLLLTTIILKRISNRFLKTRKICDMVKCELRVANASCKCELQMRVANASRESRVALTVRVASCEWHGVASKTFEKRRRGGRRSRARTPKGPVNTSCHKS